MRHQAAPWSLCVLLLCTVGILTTFPTVATATPTSPSPKQSSVIERLSVDDLLTIMNGGVLSATSSSSVSSSHHADDDDGIDEARGGPWIVRFRKASCLIPSTPVSVLCPHKQPKNSNQAVEGSLDDEDTMQEEADTDENTNVATTSSSTPSTFCGTEDPSAADQFSSDSSCKDRAFGGPPSFILSSGSSDSRPTADSEEEDQQFIEALRQEDDLFHTFGEHMFETYDKPILDSVKQDQMDETEDQEEEDQQEASGNSNNNGVSLNDIPSVFRFGDFVIDSFEAQVIAETLGINFNGNAAATDGDAFVGGGGGGGSADGESSAGYSNGRRYFKFHYKIFNAGSGLSADKLDATPSAIPSSLFTAAMGASGAFRGVTRQAHWASRIPIDFKIGKKTNDNKFQAWYKNPQSPLLFEMVQTEVLSASTSSSAAEEKKKALVMPPFEKLSNKRKRELYLLYLEEELIENVPEVIPTTTVRRLSSGDGVAPIHQRAQLFKHVKNVLEMKNQLASLASLQHTALPHAFPPHQMQFDMDGTPILAEGNTKGGSSFGGNTGGSTGKGMRPLLFRFPHLDLVDDEAVVSSNNAPSSSTPSTSTSSKSGRKLKTSSSKNTKKESATPSQSEQLRQAMLRLQKKIPMSQVHQVAQQRRMYARLQSLAAHPAFFGAAKVFLDHSSSNPKNHEDVASMNTAVWSTASNNDDEHATTNSATTTTTFEEVLSDGVSAAVLKTSRTLAPHRVPVESRHVQHNSTMADLFQLFTKFVRRPPHLQKYLLNRKADASVGCLSSSSTLGDEDESEDDVEEAAANLVDASQDNKVATTSLHSMTIAKTREHFIRPFVHNPLRHITQAHQFLSHVVKPTSSVSIVFFVPPTTTGEKSSSSGASGVAPVVQKRFLKTAQNVARYYQPLRSFSTKVDVYYILSAPATTKGSGGNKKKTGTSSSSAISSFEGQLGRSLIQIINRTKVLSFESAAKRSYALIFQPDSINQKDRQKQTSAQHKRNIFVVAPPKKDEDLSDVDVLAAVKKLGTLKKQGSSSASKGGPSFVGQISSDALEKAAMNAQSMSFNSPQQKQQKKTHQTSSDVQDATAEQLLDPTAPHFPNAEGWHETDGIQLLKPKKKSSTSDKKKKATTSPSKNTDDTKKKSGAKKAEDGDKKKEVRRKARSMSTDDLKNSKKFTDASKSDEKMKKAGGKKNDAKATRNKKNSESVPRVVLDESGGNNAAAADDTDGMDGWREPERQLPTKLGTIRDIPIGWGHFNLRRAGGAGKESNTGSSSSSHRSGKGSSSSASASKKALRDAQQEARYYAGDEGDGEYVEVIDEEA